MLRTKLWYVLLLLFSGLFAILYNDHIPMVLFLVMLILPIFLWIITIILKRYVDIRLSSDTFIGTKETPYQIIVRIRNRAFLPVPKLKLIITYRNRFLAKSQREVLVTTLDGNSEIELLLSAHSIYCGISEYKIHKAYLYDYLGLWRFRKQCLDTLNVTILPNLNLIEKALVVENPNVLVESEIFSTTKSGDDVSELFGIREYTPGDKMNRIHWKLSLKQEELMVKQFGLPVNCAVAIMLDFSLLHSEEEIAVVDALMEALLSISVSMILREQIHYVIWYDDHIQSCQRIRIEHEEDIYQTISMLYHCSPYGMEHSLLTYHEAQFGNDQYTNIYYLAPGMKEETISLLNQARKSAITHVVMMSNQANSTKEHTALHLESMGMNYTFLSKEDVASSLMEL